MLFLVFSKRLGIGRTGRVKAYAAHVSIHQQTHLEPSTNKGCCHTADRSPAVMPVITREKVLEIKNKNKKHVSYLSHKWS